MTLAADRRHGQAPHRPPARPRNGDRPVEFWPTSAIRSALEGGDIATWKQIAVAIKRDPFGRTARQVEEVLETFAPGSLKFAPGYKWDCVDHLMEYGPETLDVVVTS